MAHDAAGAVTHPSPPKKGDWPGWLSWANALPSIAGLCMDMETMTHGYARATVERSIMPLNPNGAVHGGLVAAFADQIGAMALMPMVGPERTAVTGTLRVEYLRAALLPLVLEARVERLTRALVFVRAELSSGGRVCALASGTWVPLDLASLSGAES
ncbi:PaaI family thioesterase [Pseudonocardia xishanensis]|uniref:Thioesterase domain-containing protein n=1 Tax=Pseudonocardia xishanensis TaxID=630995 RepID=A0ABP8RPR7_9PSEU